VRGCACRGTMGLAHLSCLVRQAEAAVEHDDQWNQQYFPGLEKYQKCFDCGHSFHGSVEMALAWAAWKAHQGRPERDIRRVTGMKYVGDSLVDSTALGFPGADSNLGLSILEAHLAIAIRLGGSEGPYIATLQSSIASAYKNVGRMDEALRLSRVVFATIRGKKEVLRVVTRLYDRRCRIFNWDAHGYAPLCGIEAACTALAPCCSTRARTAGRAYARNNDHIRDNFLQRPSVLACRPSRSRIAAPRLASDGAADIWSRTSFCSHHHSTFGGFAPKNK